MLVWDGDELIAHGNAQRGYTLEVPGNDLDDHLASIDNMGLGAKRFYHQTPDKSIYAVTGQGNVLEGHAYTALGEQQLYLNGAPSFAAPISPFGFQGHLHDRWTGNSSMRARMYLPRLGRFASADPIGIAGGLDVYAFVGGRVFEYRDPFGLQSMTFGGPIEDLKLRWHVLTDDLHVPTWGGVKSKLAGILMGITEGRAGHRLMGTTSDPAFEHTRNSLVWQALGAATHFIPALRRPTPILPPGQQLALAGGGATGAAGLSGGASLLAEALDDISRLKKDQAAGDRMSSEETSTPSRKCDKAGSVSPRNRLPRYHGDKPAYVVNPAHVPGRGLRPGKTPLPADAADVYKNSVPNDPTNPTAWFGRNQQGQIYRFSLGNDGTAHFSGIDGVGDGVRNLTRYALDRLAEL